MSKNNRVKYVPCIPLKKGYVQGYYEKRNGKLVWVNPYENSKTKHGPSSVTTVEQEPTGVKRSPRLDDAPQGHVPHKPVNVSQPQNVSFDWLVYAILGMVKTMCKFEPAEKARLQPALKTARSIVSELGYLDEGIKPYFEVQQVEPTRLSKKASRETAAMAKESKQLIRRITRSSLREKVQKMELTFEESL